MTFQSKFIGIILKGSLIIVLLFCLFPFTSIFLLFSFYDNAVEKKNEKRIVITVNNKFIVALILVGNYIFKVNSRNTRTRCEICSELTIKTSKRRHWLRSGVFIVNFEHISHLVLVFLLLTLSR